MDKIILGIGNPGPKYSNTRHNIGFMVIDAFADSLGVQLAPSRFKALTGQARVRDRRVLLVKPLTYVNLSGESARALCDWYKLPPISLLVVSDDLALPPGKIRVRAKGSSGGHRGLQSIIDSLKTDVFPRLRIGIGRAIGTKASYVLSRFRPEESEVIHNSLQLASETLLLWTEQDDINMVINRCNSIEPTPT